MSSTEKITIYLSAMELGQIDLLVAQGVHASRSDLIRAAIRRAIEDHTSLIEEVAKRDGFLRGRMIVEREWLEKLKEKGESLKVRIVGTVSFNDDVPPELADETVESLEIFGILNAPAAVKAILADRVTIGETPLLQRMKRAGRKVQA